MFAARLATFLVALSLLVSACHRTDQVASVECSPASADYFFPDTVLGHDDDHFRRDWYSEPLRRMAEPSLPCMGVSDRETYRFLWLRSFNHPISVRVSHEMNGVEVEAFELSGAGGYDPGTILKHVSKTLPSSAWPRLERMLERVDFWNLPTNDSRVGADGAEWIIEGHRNTSYNVVDRWSAEGSYRELGLLFLEFADFPTTGDDIY